MDMDLTLLRTKLLMVLMGINGFEPVVSESENWLDWVTDFGPFTCRFCAEQHGRVFYRFEYMEVLPPVHERCKCYIKKMMAILAGTATIDGNCGADYHMKNYGSLPGNYVLKETAEIMGWQRRKGNLRDVIPNATIGGEAFDNEEKLLPEASGRVWYEADINYTGGYRNKHRILYSNDGLIFATYDHYKTFYEIV